MSGIRLLNNLLAGVLVGVLVLVLGSIYLLAFHENPAMIVNSPVLVAQAEYRAGDEIIATFDYCRYSNAPATRYISFSDGLLYNVPTVTIPGLGKGCFVVSAFIVTVPASLPPGRYYIICKHELAVNLLATRVASWRTVEFEIVP